MLGPFTTASRLTPIHQMSLAVLSRAACASMSTTMTTTTTTTRDRGDRYGPMEWAQIECEVRRGKLVLDRCSHFDRTPVCDRQTDRQTDAVTVSRQVPRYSIASRG